MKKFKLIKMLLVGVAILSLVACKTTEEDESTVTESNDVTLAGSMSLASSSASSANIAGSPQFAAAASDYKLYCVTFTSPPKSGEGEFDADGAFSVTLTGAGGLTIGCFINDKTSGAVVSTLTFETGATDGLDSSGNSSAAALKGGKHSVAISFDPVSGKASADVSAAVDTTATAADATTGSITPALISGAWTMSCATTEEGNSQKEYDTCVQFLSEDGGATSAIPIFANVTTATLGAKVVHAFSPWSNEAAFTACGSTEGIFDGGNKLVDIKSEMSTDPTAAFTGLTSETTYNKTENSMLVSDLITWMAANGHGSFANMQDTNCQGITDVTAAGIFDGADNWGPRSCLLDYLGSLRDGQNANCMPHIADRSHKEFRDSTASSSSTIYFDTLLGGSPGINGRYELMGLEFQGTTAIASSFSEHNYEVTQDGTNFIKCSSAHELTISMAMGATDSEAFGRFTQKEYDTCNTDRKMYGSFFTKWTK